MHLDAFRTLELGLLYLIALAVLIWLIWLTARVNDLKQTLNSLQDRLEDDQTESPSSTEASPESVPVAEPVSSPSNLDTAGTDKPTETKPGLALRFLTWLQTNWLMKLGALLVIIGTGWFVTYAFMQNWIGPIGRISLGYLGGTGLIAFGWWWMDRHLQQGTIFLLVGAVMILLTTFGARAAYDFFTPASAMGLMLLTTVFVAVTSFAFTYYPLALCSLILAGFAPVLTSASDPSGVFLFGYLLLIVLGTIWLSSVTNWRSLNLIALLITSIYSPFVYAIGDQNETAPEMFLGMSFAFTLVFFLSNTGSLLRNKDQTVYPDLFTAGGTGLFLLGWILSTAPESWQSLIMTGWLLVFVCAAYTLFSFTKKQAPFFVYAGTGTMFLAAATAIELEGPAMTIAFTVEAGVIPVTGYFVLNNIRSSEALSLLMLLPMILSFDSLGGHTWQNHVLTDDFFLLLVLTLVLLALGIFFLSIRSQTENPSSFFATSSLVAGAFYFFVLIWHSTHTGLEQTEMAVAVSLISYTIIGIITYFFGQTRKYDRLKFFGGAVLGLVVLRLLLIDIWEMSVLARVVVFFIIGALLLGTAFFDPIQQKIEQDPSPSGEE